MNGQLIKARTVSEEKLTWDVIQKINGNNESITTLTDSFVSHTHLSSDVTDFENQVNEDTKGLICCKEIVNQSVTSGYITSQAISNGNLIYGDNCYYYRVKLEATVSVDRNDNESTYNYKTSGAYICFLTKTNLTDNWTISRALPITLFNTEIVYINTELIFQTSSNLYVSTFISTSGIDEGMQIIPNNNLSRFTCKLTVNKCPKTSWFKRYDLADSGWVSSPTTTITGTLPSSGTLPFIGFYHIDVYTQVRESTTIYGDDVNCNQMQLLEIREQSGTYKQIDRSAQFTTGVPNEGEKFMNRSLQGSCILEITSTSNLIEYQITLPNGLQRKLEGGYIHVKYIGSAESINL